MQAFGSHARGTTARATAVDDADVQVLPDAALIKYKEYNQGRVHMLASEWEDSSGTAVEDGEDAVKFSRRELAWAPVPIPVCDEGGADGVVVEEVARGTRYWDHDTCADKKRGSRLACSKVMGKGETVHGDGARVTAPCRTTVHASRLGIMASCSAAEAAVPTTAGRMSSSSRRVFLTDRGGRHESRVTTTNMHQPGAMVLPSTTYVPAFRPASQ
ncbi:hypothetical protein BDU57DRAFT_538859 [Ampelomyces quisqualis]|uniref:Uncharacterized protein n=1 Tax=Ampelomyces quisqualis TaxID=50730 RepID=A0A6A5QM84_AMPQU|nr:hypothetical protein BDU57DRAFT_538859 [Ampelomyces quisqualis]